MTQEPAFPPDLMRVAVASSDGRMVDEHFGSALQFVILQIQGSQAQCVEVRQNTPACGAGHASRSAADSIALIADCQALLTVQAGPPMIARLNAKGIRVVQVSGPIQLALARLLHSE